MVNYKYKEVKDLADYVKAHKKKDYELTESIKTEKSISNENFKK